MTFLYFLKEEDKFEADEERVLWFDPNAKDKADEENKDSSDDAKETNEQESEVDAFSSEDEAVDKSRRRR